MQAKRLVLKRFPTAQAIIVERWPDGGARHWSVIVNPHAADQMVLDIHDRHDMQGPKAAWQSAHFWCNRNPAPFVAGQG